MNSWGITTALTPKAKIPAPRLISNRFQEMEKVTTRNCSAHFLAMPTLSSPRTYTKSEKYF